MLKNGDHIRFLSSPAQDFIEEATRGTATSATVAFLSFLAQDFIEDASDADTSLSHSIPELSSSGLH